jgi:hypothetical protein
MPESGKGDIQISSGNYGLWRSENSPALNEICRYTIFGGRSIALTV